MVADLPLRLVWLVWVEHDDGSEALEHRVVSAIRLVAVR